MATEATSSVMAGADGGEAVITSLGTAGDVTLTGSVELSVVLTSWATLFSTGASGCSGVLWKRTRVSLLDRIIKPRGGGEGEKSESPQQVQIPACYEDKKKDAKIDSVEPKGRVSIFQEMLKNQLKMWNKVAKEI